MNIRPMNKWIDCNIGHYKKLIEGLNTDNNKLLSRITEPDVVSLHVSKSGDISKPVSVLKVETKDAKTLYLNTDGDVLYSSQGGACAAPDVPVLPDNIL